MKEIQTMLDGKAILGTVTTATAGLGGWLDMAEPIVTITVTIIVGAVTLWYTAERAMKLRRERTKDDSNKESDGPTGSSGGNGRSVGDSYRR